MCSEARRTRPPSEQACRWSPQTRSSATSHPQKYSGEAGLAPPRTGSAKIGRKAPQPQAKAVASDRQHKSHTHVKAQADGPGRRRSCQTNKRRNAFCSRARAARRDISGGRDNAQRRLSASDTNNICGAHWNARSSACARNSLQTRQSIREATASGRDDAAATSLRARARRRQGRPRSTAAWSGCEQLRDRAGYRHAERPCLDCRG